MADEPGSGQLVVETGRVHSRLQGHAVQVEIENHLVDGSENRAAAGGADHQLGPAIAQQQGGRHGRQHALAGFDGVPVVAYHPELVGYPGFGAEVIHLVVQQEAGAGYHHA